MIKKLLTFIIICNRGNFYDYKEGKMRKKSLILLGILIISMISFGCSNSNQSSDNEVISNQNNSSQQSLQNNQENSAGNN